MELLYFCVNDFEVVDNMMKNGERELEVRVMDMQIDNQIYSAPYDSVMVPVWRKGKLGEDGKMLPFLHISLVQKEQRLLNHYRYFALMMQEMRIKLDSVTLWQLLGFYEGVSEVLNVVERSGEDGRGTGSASSSSSSTSGSSSSNSSSSSGSRMELVPSQNEQINFDRTVVAKKRSVSGE
eukprot:TRINITY_DN484_c1_g1_i7.p1 TRINITY_DN484_c1_g1~~TRINITY_DN484_c1_g1_i7.p1  ORF type:complete len:180 (-),score=52.39 TRINITY_DN484_c1_g1_i7:36-575(-)